MCECTTIQQLPDTPTRFMGFILTWNVLQICATICIALLVLKRFLGGELGGRGFMRRGVAALLFFLWLFYLVMSGLQDTGKIEWSSR